MKSYCVKQRKMTPCVPGSERTMIASNGRPMMTCTCSECGITKTHFVKGQTGGKYVSKEFTCGLDPKRKPFPAEKCLDMKRVMYWGKHAIDPDLMARGPKSKQKKNRMNLISERIRLNAQLKKLRDEKKYLKRGDTDRREEINEQGQKLIKKISTINKKLQNLEEQQRVDELRLPTIVDDGDDDLDYQFAKLLERNMEEDPEDLRADPLKQEFGKILRKNPYKNLSFGWKDQTKGLTIRKIDKILEKYERRDPKIIKKIEEFVDSLARSKVGTEKPFRKFFVRKYKPNEYAIEYWYYQKGMEDTLYRVSTWHGDKTNLVEQLFQIEIGAILFQNNHAINIMSVRNQIERGIL